MNNKLVVRTDTGEELTFDVVAMVTNKLGAKNEVFFTDNTVNSEGKTVIYGAYFVIENNQVKIINDLTDEEYENLKESYEVLKNASNDTEFEQASNIDNVVSD